MSARGDRDKLSCQNVARSGSFSAVNHQASESAARRLANRSPRLHGVVTVGIGLGVLLISAAVRVVVHHTLPFVEAFGFIAVGMGLWSVLTGHTFAESPERLPAWWKAGAVIAALAGGIFGFFFR